MLNHPSDYESLSKYCKQQSAWSQSVVDNWLLEYGAERNRIDKEFDKQIKRYKKELKDYSTEIINMLRAQYMYHCIFRNGGKISAYLKQSEVIKRPVDEFRYLDKLSKTPCRYVFSIIMDEPAPDFFEMFNLITGEKLLLYSPGTNDILRQNPAVMTWLNLLHFNGRCYQSYGPIFHYQSFTARDLWCIASFMTGKDNPEDMDKSVQADPFPYYALLNYSTLPVLYHKQDKIQSSITEIIFTDKDILTKLKNRFDVDISETVTRFTLPEWKDFPHFARLYHDNDQGLLHLTTQTERAFRHFAKILCEYKLPFDDEPEEMLSMTAIAFLNLMTDDGFVADWYADYFDDDEDDDIIEDEVLEEINEFMNEIIPYVNSDEVVPLNKIAGKYGIPIEEALDLIKSLEGSVGKPIRTK